MEQSGRTAASPSTPRVLVSRWVGIVPRVAYRRLSRWSFDFMTPSPGPNPPRTSMLPTRVLPHLHLGVTGHGPCTRCGHETTYVGRQLVLSLPPTRFSLIGIGGICLDCNALVAVPQMMFDALLAAWKTRPEQSRFVCVVHRPGESDDAFHLRISKALDALEVGERLPAVVPPPEPVSPGTSRPDTPSVLPGAPAATEPDIGPAFGWLPRSVQ